MLNNGAAPPRGCQRRSAAGSFRALPPAARIAALLWLATAAESVALFAAYQWQHFEWRHVQAAVIPYAFGWVAACAAWRYRSWLLAVAPRRTLWLTIAGTLALLAILWIEGPRQFGGFDFGTLVDVAWRQHIGQQVYRDFICTLFPGFYLSAGYAFQLFGATWTALVSMTCVATAIWICWATCLLTRLLGSRPVAPLLAIAVAAMTQVVVGIWWYNPLAMLSAALFVLSALQLHRSPASWFSRCSYAASLAILLLMKPNIGGIAITGVSLILALGGWRWSVRIAVLSMAAVLLAWCVLGANGISPVAVVASYRSIAGRGLALWLGFRGIPWWDLAASVSMLCAFAFPVCAGKDAADGNGWQAARSVEGRILAVAAIGGLYSGMNNGEWKIVAGAVILMAATLFVLLRAGIAPLSSRQAPGPNPSTAVAAAIAVCAMFAAIGCGTGWYRLRVLTVGDFFEWRTLPPRQEPPFFKGLVAGPRFNETVDEIAAVLRGRPYRNVFFGPRLAFAYAAFGRSSPKRQPIWFEPGAGFARDHEADILHGWDAADFDLLVFAKDDFTYYPPAFLASLGRHYSRDDSLGRLTLFHRNQERTQDQGTAGDDKL